MTSFAWHLVTRDMVCGPCATDAAVESFLLLFEPKQPASCFVAFPRFGESLLDDTGSIMIMIDSFPCLEGWTAVVPGVRKAFTMPSKPITLS